MTMRSVGNRIAVDFDLLNLHVSKEEALEILKKREIVPLSVDVISLEDKLVGNGKWKLNARQWEAPNYFDCTSLTKWLYGQLGVWLPRRAIQQLGFCNIVTANEAIPGDILFVHNPFRENDLTGHVCIITSNSNCICASNSELGLGVIKIPIDQLLETRKLAHVGRVLGDFSKITTLAFPLHREIETVDDVRWIILQAIR